MTAEILDIPTGLSSPTAITFVYDVQNPVSSRELEEHMASLSTSPSDSPVSSAENHRVAQCIKEIKRRHHKAADVQTSQAEKMAKKSRVDL
ncbi:hypothetical protein PoB_002221900 [Plakobranchus ocellatus]|uniref:Uncharacterized protein n=1 Tax=Plakobranchus ocellatus TaxID=259542 RepID=A0AAV3ZK59_9GAST|nr:hypothetical protein PoB_002221900 [Plakobranchus ocellatus]